MVRRGLLARAAGAATGRRPWVRTGFVAVSLAGRLLCGPLVVGGLLAVSLGLLGAVAAAGGLLAGLLAVGAVGLGDGGGGGLERGADFLDRELVGGALLPVLFVAALGQSALGDDAHAAGEGSGDVLGGLAPYGGVEKEGVAVLPLVRLPVEKAGVDAMVKLATGAPDGVNRSSGSAVRFPTTVMTVSPDMVMRPRYAVGVCAVRGRGGGCCGMRGIAGSRWCV